VEVDDVDDFADPERLGDDSALPPLRGEAGAVALFGLSLASCSMAARRPQRAIAWLRSAAALAVKKERSWRSAPLAAARRAATPPA
jgi:hypothetical protein